MQNNVTKICHVVKVTCWLLIIIKLFQKKKKKEKYGRQWTRMNTFYHTYSTTNDWNLLSRLQTVRPHTFGCDFSYDSVLLHLRAVESAWRGHPEPARCVYVLMDGWSVQTTDVVSPAGHRRKWWRMVPTWYAQGLLQQEAQNHRAQIKWERESGKREK